MKTLNDYLKKYKIEPSKGSWSCHGNTIVLHKALESIATGEGIIFDSPTVVEANAADKIAVVLVTGRKGDSSEWSFGEATPYNNKMGYPYAMAEKRAKDRVILKLLGLHGEVYSESEADDFKQPFKSKSTPSKIDRTNPFARN